jgi:hypothetical protein
VYALAEEKLNAVDERIKKTPGSILLGCVFKVGYQNAQSTGQQIF